ncbi:hypothetical protein C0V77_11690 [Emticicia sp. TH156]|nr:hypothetical protein C0V77_11690 [Emticicia sp. TH156]
MGSYQYHHVLNLKTEAILGKATPTKPSVGVYENASASLSLVNRIYTGHKKAGFQKCLFK